VRDRQRPRRLPRGGGLALIAVALIFLRGNGCERHLLENPGFDLWCGDSLCDWEVEGEIARVPTWHQEDPGVALVGEDVTLHQLANLADGRAECFHFDLLIDKPDDAEVVLELDFQDDGIAEYSHPIPSYDWRPVDYKITAPTWYDSVRFILRKRGPGRAVLARILVTAGSSCIGDPLPLTDRPLGAECEADDECASDACIDRGHAHEHYFDLQSACGECRDHDDCAGEEVCGAEPGDAVGPRQACGAPGRHGLGERCVTDAECATGLCVANVCSTCRTDDDCDGGTTCAVRDWRPLGEAYQVLALPHQCGPGDGLGASGDRCLFDDDCASGACQGTGELCLCAFEGWRCADRPCEPICFTEDECNDRQLTLGVADGTCR